jgi:hypothetical protein
MTKDNEPTEPPKPANGDKKDFWQNLIRERFDKLYWQVSGLLMCCVLQVECCMKISYLQLTTYNLQLVIHSCTSAHEFNMVPF